MAISHVCLGCGFELARVRAALEPHYGLWVVTCPSCTTSAVRGRGGLVRAHRRWRRLRRALVWLALQAAFAFLLAGATVRGVVALVDDMANIGGTPISIARALMTGGASSRLRDWALNDGLIGLVLLASVSLATGLWLRSGLAHLSRVVWFVWAAALLVLTHFEWVLFPMLRAYGNLVGEPFTDHVPPDSVLASRLVMVGLAALIAALGMPLGREWSGLLARHRRRRMGRHRARLRRLQRGHAA